MCFFLQTPHKCLELYAWNEICTIDPESPHIRKCLGHGWAPGLVTLL